MYVLGTAGHVDHGKSTLIHALTSIDPDRLPEEKEREMTIDLGFAWMEMPSGREVSIVDVPGHERFIKNMLAGVGGIDLAMLVVAANESVMRQTREHLAILDLLEIRRGMVVITKEDLVDEEMVELVKAEVEDLLAPTTFRDAPMVAVSAYTGKGLDTLKTAIDSMLDTTEPRSDLGRPRLPVDRCFTVAGFGTVVTGTLIDGNLSVGSEVELALTKERCRIRGLQSHRQKLELADPGRRLAANLSGISRSEIQRGEVITLPGWLQTTNILDAQFRVSRDAPRPVRHNEGITFHLHTSESNARLRILDKKELRPGEEGWVQIHLSDPVPLVKGDLFVARSAEDTLGGGRVVDPKPRRHRRFIPSVIERLALVHEGGDDTLLNAVDMWGPCDITTLARRANLALDGVTTRLAELESDERVVLLGDLASDADSVAYSMAAWQDQTQRASRALTEFHRQHPLRKGVPREEMRSRMSMPQAVFNRLSAKLVSDGYMTEEDGVLRLPEHQASLTPALTKQADSYVAALESDPFAPPTDHGIAAELLGYLIQDGRVVKVSEEVVFSHKAYRQMVDMVVQHTKAEGSITVAQARNLLGSSRKYVLPLLEHLDQQRVTRRVGDERVLR